ncbi:centrosome and spindle pole associated protein 1, partial [Biomphalaria pfeifferi]
MTAVDVDLDSFIKQQKAKLANERLTLNKEPMHQGAKGRRKWGPPVDIESNRETEKENYKQLWHDLKGKYIEPSSNRQRWGSPVKLSPRGLLDTDALILDVQKEKERAEYEELWRRHHGMDPSPRAPINDRGAGNTEELEPTFDQSPRIQNNKEKDEYRRLWEQQHPEVVKKPSPPKMYNRTKALDTAQIIREVEREKREEEELMKMKNPLLGGGGKQDYRQGNRGLTNGQTAGVNRDEYRKLWEEQHAKRDTVGVKGNIEDTRFEDSQKNIQDKIAEAKKEAEDYRKRWEAHHNKTGRPNSEPAIENVLPLGGYEANRKKLNEERQREYNEMLRQGKFKTRSNKSAPSSEPAVEDPLPLGVYEENRRKLNEERKREYREMLQKKKMGPKSQWVQPEEEGMIPFPSQEEKRKKLNEERRKEYNEMLQKHGPPAEKLDLTELGLAPEVDESEDFGLFHNLGAADKKLKEEKRDPPNQLNLLGQNIYDKTIRKGYQSRLQEQTDDHKTALLIANESDAMKLQKIKERNEEYNKFLASKAEKEQNRFADKKPAVSQDDGVYATIPGLRYSNSAQKREKEAERNREYNEMLRQKGGRRKGWGTPTYEELLERKRAQESQYRRANDIGYEPTGNLAENYPDNMNRNLLADDLNPNLGRSEQQKRKEEYKRDLQRQIAESAQARKAERELGLLVNNNGIINPEPAVVYFEPRPRRKDPAVEAYHTKIASDLNKLDDLSPRPTALLGLGGDRRNVGGFNLDINPNLSLQLGRSGILDLGFDAALNPARITSMNPPPGVQYQPSTYVTASTVPVMNSSVDEAYNFYATRNPLEPDLNVAPLGGGGGGGRSRDVPSLNLNGIGGDGGPGSRVRFKEPREKSPPAMGMVFASDDEKKKGQRNAQAAYREELERQMMEKNIKKMKEKEEQERYDLKMEEEARTYDPFGKGGGGAPMRDQFGNVITDLRQIRNDNINRTENKYSPHDPSPYGGGGFGGVGGGYGGGGGGFGGGGGTAPGNTTRAANSYRDDLIGPPPVQTTAEGEASFARGGHGIFGMPKTEAEKVQADRYKIDLKRQIEEKRAEELRKKQLEKMEEEREQKLLEEQRAKMQREYDEEQRRLKEKEEDARRKNEEIIRAAEDKKRDMDKRRREAEEQRLLELRQERERERQMAPSPPVPAARHKQMDIEPAPSKQDFTPRAQSADVLNQLAQMRAQLQNERLRVQTMLDDQDDEVEIYDPRQGHRLPPPTSIPASRPEVDVFETAMNRNAVAVRRTPAGRRPSEDRAHPQLVEEFNALKHK